MGFVWRGLRGSCHILWWLIFWKGKIQRKGAPRATRLLLFQVFTSMCRRLLFHWRFSQGVALTANMTGTVSGMELRSKSEVWVIKSTVSQLDRVHSIQLSASRSQCPCSSHSSRRLIQLTHDPFLLCRRLFIPKLSVHFYNLTGYLYQKTQIYCCWVRLRMLSECHTMSRLFVF